MKKDENKEPLRVLMLFTILNRGGAEAMVMNYYRKIDRSKVQFDFVVHREEKGDYEDEVTALGGKIYRMMPLRPHTIGKYKRQIAKFFDEHPDYQIIHGQCSESGYFFYKEAARRGIPVIIAHAHNSHVKVDLKWFFRTWMKYKMRPYLTHYFSCGEEASEWLFGKKLAQKAIILKNAIDSSMYSFYEETRTKKRKELKLEDSNLAVCHVGRFDKVKNHSFIVDIFAELLKKKPEAKLVLIGEGELKAQTKKKVHDCGIEGQVMFLGVRRDVNELMQAADVLVFPSLFEGLPVTLVEAQCTGLPCVISDNIPSEVAFTDLVEQMSLGEPAGKWADRLITAAGKKHARTSYPHDIAKAGFDIKGNATWLQDFYLKAVGRQ